MPMYKIGCRNCGVEWDVYREMENCPAKRKGNVPRCKVCQSRKTNRVFAPHGVIDDNFAQPIAMTTLRPVRTGDPRQIDMVSSRSEHAQLLRDHDRKYGTELVVRAPGDFSANKDPVMNPY